MADFHLNFSKKINLRKEAAFLQNAGMNSLFGGVFASCD